MKPFEGFLRGLYPGADFYAPAYQTRLFSNASPYLIADELEANIAQLDRQYGYERIVLVGYSMGSLLVRKAFLWGAGEALQDRPSKGSPRSGWTSKVERLVLLAGTNRGWSLETRPREMSRWRYCATSAALAIARLSGTGKLLRSAEHGAPFVADLRVQWIRFVRPRNSEPAPSPLVVQLLGTVDDVVKRSDNEDTGASKDFVFIPVAGADHRTIREVEPGSTDPGIAQRTALVREAFVTPADELRRRYPYAFEEHAEVEDVVLVVHGIRDLGYWSDALQKEITSRAGPRRVEVQPPRYGWYSMGQFLIWPSRQQNVRRFMNDYTDIVAKYPRARVSFIGHSNGTYILASALKNYQSLEIDRAVLAGSVIPSDFDWEDLTRAASARVGSVRNIVGGDDWVVAFFPRLFELARKLPFLHHVEALDVGAAGFLGFQREAPQYRNVKFLTGGHGAFIDDQFPERAQALAAYVLDGDDAALDVFRRESRPARWVSSLSPACWVVWLLLLAVVSALGWAAASLVNRVWGWRGRIIGSVYAVLVLLLIFSI